MAITDAEIIGYRGTVDEIAYAMLSAVPEGRVGGEGDWLVTAVGETRRVSFASGRGKHGGVLAITEQAYVRDVPDPATGTGQWWIAVATRTWHRAGVPAREFDFRLVAGPATSATPPEAPPVLLPASLAADSGRELDQVLAWVWAGADQPSVLIWDWRHDRPRPFPLVRGTGGGTEAWSGTPVVERSVYSLVSGRVLVDQVFRVRNNGDRIGAQIMRPFRAAPAGMREFTQEGRGGIRRPGGIAILTGITSGRAGTTVDEARFDLMSTSGSYVGQTNIQGEGPFGGWRAGDYLAIRYDYQPLFPLTPTI